jgi:peptidoglycan/xylan/chitin deacetylase (PgdA/CDA1 family)
MRALILKAARVALHDLQGLAFVRWKRRRLLRILTYHRFTRTSDAALRRQCEHIVRYYKPLSMQEAVEGLCNGSLPDNALAITVDDGYRDFLLGHEVFQSFGIPVTVFIVSGFLDGLWLWYDQVLYAVRHSRRERVQVEFGQPVSFDLRQPEEREKAAQAIVEQAKSLADRQRLQFVKSLAERFDVDLPARPVESDRPLTWADVRSLKLNGVEFGVHTATHPILSKLETDQELAAEIEEPSVRLREELGVQPRYFCYPNGQPGDFDERCVESVRKAGYQAAVTTVPGMNPHGADLLRLRRLSIEPTLSDQYFEETLAGLH